MPFAFSCLVAWTHTLLINAIFLDDALWEEGLLTLLKTSCAHGLSTKRSDVKMLSLPKLRFGKIWTLCKHFEQIYKKIPME